MKIKRCLRCGYDAFGKDEGEAQFILSIHSSQMHAGERVTEPSYTKIWMK